MTTKKRARTNRPLRVSETKHEMRACTVFQRKTGYLPRATTLGYGKYTAKPGDLVTWAKDDGETMYTGRVMGLVDAPARADQSAIKGWLLVMLFAKHLTHAYPVWVDPADVTEVRECPSKLMAFLLSDAFHTLPVEDLLYLSRYGTLSEEYVEGWEKRLDERDTLARKAQEEEAS